jgi:soluble lytic murein transglycosylase-like protein
VWWVLVAALALLAATKLSRAGDNVIPFEALFSRAGARHGVPKRLLIAISAHETGGSFNARSFNGEPEADRRKGRNVDSVGLMQILYPDTAVALRPGTTLEELYDPELNVDLGARLVAQLLARFPRKELDGFPADTVAAYNAGSPRHRPDGSFFNQRYVDAVRTQWRVFANV